jgi:TolB-like protein
LTIRVGDSGDDQRLIRTVPRKGFRFIGEVEEVRAAAVSAVAAPPPATPVPTEPLVSESLLLDRPSVAVLPFTNIGGDPQQDYFSDGITEDITTELSRFSELIVIARNSAFQYKGKAVDIRQVGRELAARYVLEGSVRRWDDRIRITAQLIDTVTGAPLGRAVRPRTARRIRGPGRGGARDRCDPRGSCEPRRG